MFWRVRGVMKVGKDFGRSERADVERLAAVRAAVGDDIEILIDANNGYYAKQAIRMAREFEPYRIGWFEEPVLAAVAAAIDIPSLSVSMDTPNSASAT